MIVAGGLGRQITAVLFMNPRVLDKLQTLLRRTSPLMSGIITRKALAVLRGRAALTILKHFVVCLNIARS